jgi:hypothetical protein
VSTVLIQNYSVGTEQMGPVVPVVQTSILKLNYKNSETATFVQIMDPHVEILLFW